MTSNDAARPRLAGLREQGARLKHVVSPELLRRHSPVPHYQRALTTVRAAPWLLAWKIGWDFLYRVVALSVVGFVVVLIAEHFDRSMTVHGDLLVWAEEFAHLMTSPAFITGSVGVLGVCLMIAMACDAFIRGGIWGTLAAATRLEQDITWRTFVAQGARRFTAMIGFKLLSYLVWIFLAAMGLTLLVGLVRVSTIGAFQDAGPLGLGALWGIAGAIYLSTLVLFRLTLASVCAPLFLEERQLGDALYVAAHFVVDHTLQLYRLLLVMLGFTLIPLGLYWCILMFQNLAIWYDTWVGLAGILRFIGDLVLLATISAISVLFYGALLAYYEERRPDVSREIQSVAPICDEVPS